MTDLEPGPAGAQPRSADARRVRAAPRRRWPFRLRLLAALVVLTVLGIVASNIVAYLTDRQRAAARNDASLTLAVEAFRMNAGDTPVPGEDRPSFGSVSELVTSAVNRSVNTTGECTIGLVGDDLPVHDGSAAMCDRVLEDDRFGRTVRQTSPTAAVTIRRLTADSGRYAYVVVPVTLRGDARQGYYVDVIDEGAQMDEIQSSYLRTSLPLAGLTALLVVGVGWLLSGQVIRPLRNLVAATAALEADSSARVPVEGADEVGELARAMNGAMDRIDAAFTSQRQLVDDVGHELRTPLQIIRGNLELADPHDPQDVKAAHAV
ncbi:MAG: HAMP domain-containing protein, partial [Cellulomonas sp.]|nr:HAMP domain-containing protein [Cellulomonas sp.]